MIGTDAATGAPLDGDAHLAQSIADILSTPVGSRVLRRDYGSAIFELLDGPINRLTSLRLFAATAVAIARWEPRLRLTRVGASNAASSGTLSIDIEGTRTDDPAPTDLVRLSIPLRPVSA